MPFVSEPPPFLGGAAALVPKTVPFVSQVTQKVIYVDPRDKFDAVRATKEMARRPKTRSGKTLSVKKRLR